MGKVLVIGGGPAGLFAAEEAVKKGFDVTLMEKGRIGENIRCAEGFFDVLKLLGKPCAGVRFKVDTIVFEALSLHKFDSRRLNLWMIDRSTWQKELAKRAEQKGVRIIENSPVLPEDMKNLKSKYDFVIDASGAPSVTSKLLGFLNFYRQNSGKTVQYLMEGDFSHLKNSIKVGFLPDFWGYYWIFPKGGDESGRQTANVGIGDFNPDSRSNLRKMLDDVLKKEGIDTANYKIIKVIGGICPTRMLDRLAYDNIMLVGDAAGLTSPLHGGGIDMAVLSGMMCARTLPDGPESYEKALRNLLYGRLNFEEMIARAWRKRTLEQVDKILATAGTLGLHKLLAHPRLMNPLTAKFLEFVF
ncbi:MAG: digeranylgeranylglycerophospholipid reductase [Tepidanaerobacteraceae bacterium]|nr:digeranylgeranylglycerophospholipid reductase [Tepidanaerobacteraceae bacterium]